jgi:hypothetical protein
MYVFALCHYFWVRDVRGPHQLLGPDLTEGGAIWEIRQRNFAVLATENRFDGVSNQKEMESSLDGLLWVFDHHRGVLTRDTQGTLCLTIASFG